MEIETEGEAAVPIIEKNENRQSNNQSYKKETQRRSRSPARDVQSFIQSKIWVREREREIFLRLWNDD